MYVMSGLMQACWPPYLYTVPVDEQHMAWVQLTQACVILMQGRQHGRQSAHDVHGVLDADAPCLQQTTQAGGLAGPRAYAQVV